MKKMQWLAMGILLSTAGAASATPAYGVIHGANIILETTTSLSSTPTLILKDSSLMEETCPGPDGGLDMGDVNSSLTKANLSLLLSARTSNADVAVGFDDVTCVVHTMLIGQPSS